MKVYFSKTGIKDIDNFYDLPSSHTLLEVINEISTPNNHLKATVLSGNSISSACRVFANVDVKSSPELNNSYKFFENEKTVEIKNINLPLDAFDNILVSIFDINEVIELLDKGLSLEGSTSCSDDYIDKNGTLKQLKQKPMIERIGQENIIFEEIYKFKNGDTSLASLEMKKNKQEILLKNGKYDKVNSKILPSLLADAIRDLWELPSGAGTLRLFQEDALFSITDRLINSNKGRSLLLSMPTGGGKTEAFMIPVISNIFCNKQNGNISGVQSVIVYPTKALANDQAMRFIELIHKINSKLEDQGVEDSKLITIGVLSGDTPDKLADSIIKICPKCGGDSLEVKNDTLKCKECGANLKYCRLTKHSIIDNPPDILITNPDFINYALTSPRYLKLFKSGIKSIVFDEVHMYQGIFGCHVSHLLRRLERLLPNKPVYVGMSATIGNAKELAALLFNEKIEKVEYIFNENNRYLTNEVAKVRAHIILDPALIKKSKNSSKDKYTRSMSVAGITGIFLGHLIADSHFRKSIIFTNYRQESDDLAQYLKERERFDIKDYLFDIEQKLVKKKPLTPDEVDICEFIKHWVETIKDEGNINPVVRIGWNRGGLEKETRIRSIHSFSKNTLLKNEENPLPIDLMVATKTLEVGIDIGDVTTVINSSAPNTINEYVQRVGRGGRQKDSIAITAINPENALDAHMKHHFESYVKPTVNDFEDAPIIINNEVIIKRHIRARVLDYLTEKYLESPTKRENYDLTFGNVVNDINIVKNGKIIKIGNKVGNDVAIQYADALFDEIFKTKDSNGKTELDKFFEFLNNETIILKTKQTELKEEDFKNLVEKMICDINDKLQTKDGTNAFCAEDYLTGLNSKMPEYMINMRSTGANVKLVKNGKCIDEVSRQTAFNSMPLAASNAISTVKSGVSTFKIYGQNGNGLGDNATAVKISKIVRRNADVANYFRSKFDVFPEDEDDFDKPIVASELQVEYFPSRFYCENCQRGLTRNDYREKDYGIFCNYCNKQVVQLHKVYLCKNEECGALYDAPVPMVCFNQNCNSFKIGFGKYLANGNRFTNEVLKCFKFKLDKTQKWKCTSCGSIFDFTSLGEMGKANGIDIYELSKKYKSSAKDSKDYFSSIAVAFPEYRCEKSERVEHVYRCKTFEHNAPLRAIPVPRVRTVAFSYLGKGNNELCSPISNETVNISFSDGYVIQLANQFQRRYSVGLGDNEEFRLKTDRITDVNTVFWGNYYDSHIAWIKFGDKLDSFLKDKKFKCLGNCASCKKMIEGDYALEMGATMQPKPYLEDYNYDNSKHMPRRPDARGKFCDYACTNKCDCQICEGIDSEKCEKYDREKFLKYIIIHTLKHAILWALPKFVGVTESDVRGEIFPNDNKNIDLALIDNNEGGSGAIHLIGKHWSQIWCFVKDIIQLAANNEANIILPHNCSRGNADLCPLLTKEFLDYLEGVN